MEDYQIIEKILDRDPAALDQTERQYGDACRAVAGRILRDDRAAEAVAREALLRAWETIPPKQPRDLKTYLLRITRNLAVDRAPRNGEYGGALRELDRCVRQQADGSDAPLPTKELRGVIKGSEGKAPSARVAQRIRYRLAGGKASNSLSAKLTEGANPTNMLKFALI